MIFLDTSYINSLVIKNDPYRQYANDIQPILKSEAKVTNITVLLEVLNSISPYNFFGDVTDLRNYLLNLQVFDFLSENDYNHAFELFEYYNRSINFANCTILVSMQKQGIGRIASFDKDFDKIKGIQRICGFF